MMSRYFSRKRCFAELMMAEEENDKRICATFTWILENVSCCWHKNFEAISSPAFAVDSIEGDRWRLRLYLRGSKQGSDVGVFLERMKGSNGPPTIEVVSELAILAVDGSPLTFRKGSMKFYGKGRVLGYADFVIRKEAFTIKRSIFLPDDTLTIRCKMWGCENVKISKVFLARTRIGIERRSFLWDIEKFSSLKPYEKKTYVIKTAAEDKILMSLNIFLTGGPSCEEVIRLEFTALDQRIKFSILKVFILGASGDVVECFQGEIWFDVVKTASQILFRTKKLNNKKDVFFPNDVLSLHFECAFSTGVKLDEVEEIGYQSTVKNICTLQTENPSGNCFDFEEKLSASSSTLKDNLKFLFTDRILCDTELRTCTEAFPAHKNILSARSPVFKAMFETDMREKSKEYVEIEDLKDDTVRRMLLYMYTAVVEELQWESASELYAAADKYEILTLKNECSFYLKANLSPHNACEVLLLSDLHQDDDLKSVVQDFIMKHDKDIINSNEWKNLMQANVKLAADTMYLKFKE